MSDSARAVLIAGEGRHELGSRRGHTAYASGDEQGVLEALLRRVQPSGWYVKATRTWRGVTKLRPGQSRSAEQRTVLALALDAREAGCDVLVFSRDSDGDADRVASIEAALAALAETDDDLRVVGGAAIACLEAWALALTGKAGTESLSVMAAQRRLTERLGADPTTEALTALVAESDLARVPEDAASLRRWLERAESALP